MDKFEQKKLVAGIIERVVFGTDKDMPEKTYAKILDAAAEIVGLFDTTTPKEVIDATYEELAIPKPKKTKKEAKSG